MGAAQGPPDGGRRRDTRAGEGAPAAAAAVAGRDVSLTPRRGCLVRVRRASARARRACADAPPKRLGPTPLLRCGKEWNALRLALKFPTCYTAPGARPPVPFLHSCSGDLAAPLRPLSRAVCAPDALFNPV